MLSGRSFGTSLRSLAAYHHGVGSERETEALPSGGLAAEGLAGAAAVTLARA